MKQLKKAPLIALIALSLSSSACEVVLLGASLASDGDSEEYDDGGFSDSGNTNVEAASFSGTIGDVADLSTEANAIAWDDGDFASITLNASIDGWSAMVAIDVSGADREALFTAGSVITLSAGSTAYSYACSGEGADTYAYETGNQTEGVITVSEAPDDMLQVDFEVTYTGNDTATGSFLIEAR